MLLPPVMAHQQLFARMVHQQVLQKLRELPLAQLGADMVMGPSGQRGHGTVDMHLGMVIPRGDLGHRVDQTPRRGQRGMAAHRRRICRKFLFESFFDAVNY